jgi:hypothetical protein
MNSFKSNVEVRNYVEVWRTNTRSGVGMRCTGLLCAINKSVHTEGLYM